MKTLHIKHLMSGGVITNYHCTSTCRHCLYRSSPKRDKRFIDSNTLQQVLNTIMSLGCRSIHIGGGEPFLNIDDLENLLKIAKQMGVRVEYIETNSSWFTNMHRAVEILKGLKEHGLTMLLVSISPLHNEYIPFRKVKGVIEACMKTGISVYPWVMEFYKDIDAMDNDTTHPLEEYVSRYGSDYIEAIPMRYWIHFAGRSLDLFNEHCMVISTEQILEQNSGCTELDDTSHFHFDLHGNYIPGLCSGLAISVDDILKPLKEKKYPLLAMLYEKGVGALYEFAVSEYGFSAQRNYLSKCHLCWDIRTFIVKKHFKESNDTDFTIEAYAELSPLEFYLLD